MFSLPFSFILPKEGHKPSPEVYNHRFNIKLLGRQKWRTRKDLSCFETGSFHEASLFFAQDALVCAEQTFLKDHRILEWLGLERTLKVGLSQPPEMVLVTLVGFKS